MLQMSVPTARETPPRQRVTVSECEMSDYQSCSSGSDLEIELC